MTKTVVVTGAGRGIGRAVALAFGRRGAQVILAARTSSELDAVAQQVKAAGGQAHVVACDVGAEDAVRQLMQISAELAPSLDVLVCAAGVARVAPISELTLEQWETTLRANLTGTFLACKYALPLLAAGSVVVTISSIAGRSGFPEWSAYSAAKFGVIGFSQALREEVRPRGIRVTTLIPSAVDTPLWGAVPGEWNRSNMLQPAEVAAAVEFVVDQPPHVQLDEVSIGHMAGRL